MAFNQGCRGIIPGKRLDHVFLYYFLAANRQKLDDLGSGTTFKELSGTNLKGFRIPLPPLEEQKRIVAVLDQAFAALDRARANAEANLEDTAALFQRMLEDTYCRQQSPRQRLSELIDIGHGFAFKSKDFRTSDDTSLPVVLTPGNYSEDGELYFRSGKTKRLTTRPPQEFTFEEGELTIVMTDLSSKMKILGKPAFIDRSNILHNQRIGRVRFLKRSLLPRYLYHFLKTHNFSEFIKATATGTMVRHTAPKRVLCCEIPLPAVERQAEIVGMLDVGHAKTIELRRHYEGSLSRILVLRNTLLREAFSGQLT